MTVEKGEHGGHICPNCGAEIYIPQLCSRNISRVAREHILPRLWSIVSKSDDNNVVRTVYVCLQKIISDMPEDSREFTAKEIETRFRVLGQWIIDRTTLNNLMSLLVCIGTIRRVTFDKVSTPTKHGRGHIYKKEKAENCTSKCYLGNTVEG